MKSGARLGIGMVLFGMTLVGCGGGGGKCANPGDGKIFGSWRATANDTGATGTYTLTYTRTTDVIDTVGTAVLDLDLTWASTARAGCYEKERLVGSVALQSGTANHAFAGGTDTRTGCTDPSQNVTGGAAMDAPAYQAKLTAAYTVNECELTIGGLVFTRE